MTRIQAAGRRSYVIAACVYDAALYTFSFFYLGRDVSSFATGSSQVVSFCDTSIAN